MNDWITKINYAATFKTVGLKMRHIRSSSLNHTKSLSISNISNRVKTQKGRKNTYPQPYFNYQQSRNDGGNVNDVHNRSELLKVCTFYLYFISFYYLFINIKKKKFFFF